VDARCDYESDDDVSSGCSFSLGLTVLGKRTAQYSAANLNAPPWRRSCELKFAVNTYFGDENVRVRKSLRVLKIGEPGTIFRPT